MAKNRAGMNQIVMEAFWRGLANLTTAFFDKAKKQGFSIILLIIVSGGLLARSISAENGCDKRVQAVEQRLEATNAAWSEALSEAREDWYRCDSMRQAQALRIEQQAGQIAELRFEMRFLSRKR